METMLTYNTNSETGPVCGGRAPNPFNPVTSIQYSIPVNTGVELIIYDIAGRQVQTLISDFKIAGYHSVNWNASSYPSGMYFVKMVTGEFTQTQKLVLVK